MSSANNGTATSTPPTSESSSSAPVSLTSSSSNPPPSSSPPPTSNTAPASSSQAPSTTSTSTASSKPPSTTVVTSVVTPTPSKSGESVAPSTVVVTISNSSPADASVTSADASASASSAPGLQDPKGSKQDKGLSDGGRTAIAVVVPVVAVALLVLAGILFWRKRKQRKNAEEARRKEVEEYGFNPNNDPTLPAVGMQSEMAEDQSGYRGWGNTTTSSNRKASTTLTSGMTYSDSNSNPGGYQSPGSPTQGTYSDGQSGDPLVQGRRETMDSDGIGALGAAPNASQNQGGGVHRGPSNASSSYSAADRSDNSGDYPIPVNNPQDYYDNNAYYQAGPYEANGYNQQPIIRDVSARRNTRIENPSVFPQQGNSGIAQNF